MGTISHHFDWDGGAEVEAVLEYSFSPHVAAQISGPVEICHPAEGGVEPDNLTVNGLEVDWSIQPFADWLARLVELAEEQEQEAAEGDPDAAYEAWRDRRDEEFDDLPIG